MHKQEISNFTETGQNLQNLIDAFKIDSPALSKSIEDYQKLPTEFLSKFEEAKNTRSSLEGFSQEEAGEEIDKFTDGIKSLKQKRAELETAIKNGYQDLSTRHSQMHVRKNDLTRQLSEYRRQQDRLLDKSSKYQTKRSLLENTILDYKSEETMYKSELTTARNLEVQYKSHQQNYQTSQQKLQEVRQNAEINSRYARDIEAKMRHALAQSNKYAGWAQGHAKKAKQVANLSERSENLGSLLPSWIAHMGEAHEVI
jgi:chromosome segregation ATPase